MTINEMLKKAKRFQRGYMNVINKAFQQNNREILEMQKSQLLSGIDSNGKTLQPTYSSDPYFKTPEGRQKYTQMKTSQASIHEQQRKYKIFPNKSPDVPNLIVTGAYHRGLRSEVARGTISIVGTWSRSPRVEEKYPTALGLTQKGFNYLFERYAREDLITYWHNV